MRGIALILGVIVFGVDSKHVRDGFAYDEEFAKLYLEYANIQRAAAFQGHTIALWNAGSNITDYNDNVKAAIGAIFIEQMSLMNKQHKKFPYETFKDPDLHRQFSKLIGDIGYDQNEQRFDALEMIVDKMTSIFGKGKVCPYKKTKKSIKQCNISLDPDITKRFVNIRDPDELAYYWKAWRDATGKKMRNYFIDYVQISNAVSKLKGFNSTAEEWIDEYDKEDFPKIVQDLWHQLEPLYVQLHAYVRGKLRETYGEKLVSKTGPIPAHLFGNMWAQKWNNIFDLTLPFPNKRPEAITKAMKDQGYTPLKMFKLAENFFVSLNLSKMTDTFWKNSIIEKPADGRDLICHPSAWDFHNKDDFRIQMCTVVSLDDFKTIHHEMGHIQYYIQYKDLPDIYRGGANPGFQEAIGDTMALSVTTPKHLHKIGLMKSDASDEEMEINGLFKFALEKIAFVPFSYMVDKYRWDLFRGETKPENYNCRWWQLREKYQGLEPPMDRSEEDFDAGSKFHVAVNDEYIDYFVALILQFQFHKSLCQAAGEYDPQHPEVAPLFKCDVYGSAAAGNVLKKMLALGSSKPWPEVLEQITGKPDMDASPILEYFSSLLTWLEKENKRTGEYIGWTPTKKKVCSGK